MNCKPGDLAVIVRSLGGRNLGRVVCCVRLHCSETHDADGVPISFGPRGPQGPRWVLERPLPCGLMSVADVHLRPIRDTDGEDETLTWAPKREGVTA